MTIKNRIYASRVVSGMGDWMTMLAISLWVNEKFGTEWVPICFLISSLPHLLFSRFLVKATQSWNPNKVYLYCQLILSVNVLSLIFFETNLIRIYIYLGVAASVSALARPLWDSMIGMWFTSDDRKEVFTRLGSINSALLILAPASGGMLSQFFGFESLFIIDSISYLLGISFVFPMLMQKRSFVGQTLPFSQVSTQMNSENIAFGLKRPLFAWYLLLVMGVLINGTEFAAFSFFSYSSSQSGLVLASWGVGGLLSFMFSKSFVWKWGNPFASFALAFGLSVFLMLPNFYLSCLLFVCNGFFNSYLGGQFRASIQNAISDESLSKHIWALMNQRLSIINILGYVFCSLILTHASLAISASLLLTIGLILVVVNLPSFNPEISFKFKKNA